MGGVNAAEAPGGILSRSLLTMVKNATSKQDENVIGASSAKFVPFCFTTLKQHYS